MSNQDSKFRDDENDTVTDNAKKAKKKYVKPEILSEDLVAFGAVCNGTTIGGRKASTLSCNQRKLNS